MKEIKIYKCDDCGYIDNQQDPKGTPDHCFICDNDFCVNCAEQHAREETGLTW